MDCSCLATSQPTNERLPTPIVNRQHRSADSSRCRLSDCSAGSNGLSHRLAGSEPTRQRLLEREDEALPATSSQGQRSWWARGAKRADNQQQRRADDAQQAAACSIWRFPWLLALACCLAILLAGVAVSACVVCRRLSGDSGHRRDTPRDDSRSPQPPSSNGRTSTERGHTKRPYKYLNYDNRDYTHGRPVDVVEHRQAGQTKTKLANGTRRSSDWS